MLILHFARNLVVSHVPELAAGDNTSTRVQVRRQRRLNWYVMKGLQFQKFLNLNTIDCFYEEISTSKFLSTFYRVGGMVIQCFLNDKGVEGGDLGIGGRA